jgi:hypothetical protein
MLKATPAPHCQGQAVPRAQEDATASEVQDLVKSALQLTVLAKNLRKEVLQFNQEFANVSIDNPIVFVDYNKARKEIAEKALTLRDIMVSYLIELASKVPLNKEDYINAINVLYSLNPYEPEKTIANDAFLQLYTSLVLSAIYAKGGAPPTPVFVPMPLQQGTEGTKTKVPQ